MAKEIFGVKSGMKAGSAVEKKKLVEALRAKLVVYHALERNGVNFYPSFSLSFSCCCYPLSFSHSLSSPNLVR